jgi:hypothetical protein
MKLCCNTTATCLHFSFAPKTSSHGGLSEQWNDSENLSRHSAVYGQCKAHHGATVFHEAQNRGFHDDRLSSTALLTSPMPPLTEQISVS